MAFQKKRVRRRTRRVLRPRNCRFCEENLHFVDFKDVEFLVRFMTEKGKIIPRRITGNCSKHQKILAQAIRRGRNIALLP